MSASQHLLTVWNPHYASDALDQHLNVLLDWNAKVGEGKAAPEDVYVWWAKVRSPRRTKPLEHMDQILALAGPMAEGTETHLYLTDYQSLYVGWLTEIRKGDLPEGVKGEGHVPSYYLDNEWPIDFWMKLRDIRCVVLDDTRQACREMGNLLNVRYDRKPVSIYGGMVDIPLIVEPRWPHLWFAEREAMTGGSIWAEFDASIRSETSRYAKELRAHMFGRRIWDAMEPESRRFLAAGEAIFRARSEDPNFDFSTVVVEYAKAVETELNALLFPTIREAMAKEPIEERLVDLYEKKEIDLGTVVLHQGIGSIRHLLTENRRFKDIVWSKLRACSKFLTEDLPPHLEELGRYRNPGAHKLSFDSAAIEDVRNRILGIACEGLLVKIVNGKIRVRGGK